MSLHLHRSSNNIPATPTAYQIIYTPSDNRRELLQSLPFLLWGHFSNANRDPESWSSGSGVVVFAVTKGDDRDLRSRAIVIVEIAY